MGKTFKFKQFYKIYMDDHIWFHVGSNKLYGCDFKKIFLLSPDHHLRDIVTKFDVDTFSKILNRKYLDYNDNFQFRYDVIKIIEMYDKEEYYR